MVKGVFRILTTCSKLRSYHWRGLTSKDVFKTINGRTLPPISCRVCNFHATTTLNAERYNFSCPDIVTPSTDLWTTKRDGAVAIRMSDSGPGSVKPLTVHTFLKRVVDDIPDKNALAVKRGGAWQKWTYQEYYDDIIRTAKGFVKLGLEPSHGVGIIGFNSPEWFMSNIGAIIAGGLGVGIYTTNTVESCRYVLANAACNVAVVEDDEQLQKILQVWESLPHLKAIVQYSGEVKSQREGVFSWNEFRELTKSVSDEELQERIAQQSPNNACVVLHTSGTTGEPKGALVSHDNAVWLAERLAEYFGFRYGEESIVSYLPLSHTFAQTVDMFFLLSLGGEVYFADPNALKGSLVNTLQDVRPTLFIGVPRVFEKIEESMKDRSLQVKGIKKKIGAWSRRKGLEGFYAKIEGRPLPFGWKLANKLVLSKVQSQLGFDRLRFVVAAAAPLKQETLNYLFSFDIKICCGYGMTENTGPATCENDNNIRFGSVGKEFGGCQTKIVNPDEKGIGEVCVNGRHLFMGYIDMEAQTRSAIDEEGWLHSGDSGYIDNDGFLYITGRIKELLITAGGENIAPVPIEENVMKELPVVANCVLIGDNRHFLSLLLTFKVDIDLATGIPTDTLTTESQHWVKSLGFEAEKVSDILDNAAVHKAIQEGIDRANTKAVSRAAFIQKWKILEQDFSIVGGELGPTTKVRRPIVMEMYKDVIDSLYK